MRALVLGATGHIGAHTVRQLLLEGHTVRAAIRSERFISVLDKLPVERSHVDLDTGEGLKEALDGCDWVFHAAGYYPGYQADRNQALSRGIGTIKQTLEAFQKADLKRIVFVSSAATIARIPGRLANEQDAETWPLNSPRPLYATVKIAMENEVMVASRAGLPIVTVNPTVCLGEYDAHFFSGRLILAFAKYRLPFYMDKTVSTIYTGDVAVGLLRAAEKGKTGERYLLTHQAVALKELALITCRLAGCPPPFIRLPLVVARLASEISEGIAWAVRTEPLIPREMVRNARISQELDGSKAVRELGIPQTSPEESIRRALAWFRQAGYL